MLMPNGAEFILFFLFILYILSSVFISIEGNRRKIGLVRSIFICLLLTPITGYYFVLKSKKKTPLPILFYKCGRCGHKYNHKHKYCPACESNGRYIKLRTVS